jgi:hypothetical protein
MSTDKIATYKVGATPLFAEEAQPPSSLYKIGREIVPNHVLSSMA